MKEKKVASLKIVFEDGSDYFAICEKGMDKDEVIKRIERAFTPAEPLIKDEKIRKAVRAWAEMHKIKKAYYCEYSWKNHIAWLEDGEDEACTRGESASIDIPIIEVENRKYYTIAELCGEEEE